ncbi:hypothetical protein [Massilia consociata]|uniref:Lipoprotein n=1 Tax=Massilia consociata TaxID=760117 RepID=A0ABV6FGZ4_9BURK
MKHYLPGPMSRFLSLLPALPLLLGGCATLSDSPVQQLELHAVLDYREVAGVGCILNNDKGRWFVVVPGRVTVTRSSQPLTVTCKKDGMRIAQEVVGARADTASMMGNVVISAGLGQLVDRHSGAGYGYPAHVTVLMEAVNRREELAEQQRVESPVF